MNLLASDVADVGIFARIGNHAATIAGSLRGADGIAQLPLH